MRNPRTRILITLAASDTSLSELHRFFAWVNDVGPGMAMRILEGIRYDFEKYDDVTFRSSSRVRLRDAPSSHKKTSARLEQLLLEETGLSKEMAVHMLLYELKNENKSKKPLPAYNKISFGVWLERMSQRVGQNAILQAASRIRNNQVSQSNTHWPLRKD